jgi:hypothetical protein
MFLLEADRKAAGVKLYAAILLASGAARSATRLSKERKFDQVKQTGTMTQLDVAG